MNKSTAFAWIDFQNVLICAFVLVMVAAVLAMSKTKPIPTTQAIDGPMTVIIKWPELREPDGHIDYAKTTDYDVWVQCPKDIPVGYSSTQSAHASLMHDDLGHDYVTQADRKHWEKISVRDLVPGEYVFNLQAYGGLFPTPVDYVIQMRDMETGETKTVFERHDFSLGKKGDELTLIRFRIDENGKYVPGSESTLQKKIFHLPPPGPGVAPPKVKP